MAAKVLAAIISARAIPSLKSGGAQKSRSKQTSDIRPPLPRENFHGTIIAMDRQRYSFIAHKGMKVWNPLQHLEFAEIAERLTVPSGGTVLDIGCGCGYWLTKTAEAFDIETAIGVDASPYAANAARREAAGSTARSRIRIIESNSDPAVFDAESFDLIYCIGATQALSNYGNALREAHRLLRANSELLVGEGYWKREPDPEYLAFLDCNVDAYTSHDDNCRRAAALGFKLVWSYECTSAEWEEYEDRYAKNVEAYVAANPNDPEKVEMLNKARTWRDHYLRFGHNTLGFGLYLLSKNSHG
jgi:ubiquinone/menaquinone biosynthesis C-methylase UbiE